MYILIAYIVYLMLSAILVVVVGYLFYRAGDAYIHFLFPKEVELGKTINKLLLIAYYLLNLGFILYFLQRVDQLDAWNAVLHFIAEHLSTNILTIAGMHYLNLFWLRLLAHKLDYSPKS
jgi:hypothetical protein